MDSHNLWHLIVLGSTLMGAAGLGIVLLAPLVFEQPPPGLARFRPMVLGLVGLAAVLLAAEWLGVH